MSTRLGTLGFHLDGRPCRVGCDFCYLGLRPLVRAGAREASLDPALLAEIVAQAPARDVAVAISEPAARWRAGLEAVAGAARARGLALAVTTTPEVVEKDPWVADAATRLTLSVDPAKGELPSAGRISEIASHVARVDLEVVALPSLVSPEYCDVLASGLVAGLLDAPHIDIVALNGLKPPPPWCDTRFWMSFLARLGPLLDRHLGKRLHLDCYVGARILGLGACPAKPDVAAGREFRACVYQAQPDFTFTDATDLATRVADYTPPAVCPFPIV